MENKNNYHCNGTIKIVPIMGEMYSYFIGCPHTCMHNPRVSKYVFAKDKKKKQLGVQNYREYLKIYGS